jgi:Asp-tRNA(Asn)/Glu-tRNA(Gln) amidotransferase A subunit family amidase
MWRKWINLTFRMARAPPRSRPARPLDPPSWKKDDVARRARTATLDSDEGGGAGRASAPVISRRSLLGTGGALAAGTAAAMTVGSGSAAASPPDRTAPSPWADPDNLPKLHDIPKRARLVDYEVVELAAMLRAGTITSVQLTQAYLARIESLNGPFEVYGDNGGYNAFVRINADEALAAAQAADKRLRDSRDQVPLICGIPMGVKDSVAIKGFSTQDGSAAFKGNIALEDATIVGRLRAAGAVIIGHTICSAFSGSITGTFAGNAWNKDFVPGGSSQGSGVAPVARLAAACIGEETGGSIIMPSAANGASGIKPSLGTVSIAGLMPLSPGYDVLGPITRSMRDSALVLATMIGDGPDAVNDPQTLAAPNPFPTVPMVARTGKRPLAGVTIGIPQTDWMNVAGKTQVGTSPQDTYGAGHLAVFKRLIGQLESLGAKVVEFAGLDITDPTQNPYFASTDVLTTVDGSNVTPSTAVVNSNRYEIRFAQAVADFCASGIPSADSVAILTSQYGRKGPNDTAANFASASTFNGGIPASARYEGEQRRRTLIANYTKALSDSGIDFMLVMALGDVIGKRVGSSGFPNFRAYYQVPNAIAWPMVSFPAGYVSGLAASAQFWGPRFSEADIIQAALDYQANFPDYNHAAPIDPVITPVTPAKSAQSTNRAASSPAIARTPEDIPAAPGAPEDTGPSNDPLIGEAQVRAARS